MINADEAVRLILDATPILGKEKVLLLNSLNRTLAADLAADESLPPFDNSSMDGYAVNSSDVSQASPGRPCELEVIGESSAGKVFESSVGPGQSVKVMTGGKIPLGADAVVPVESVTLQSDARIILMHPVAAGKHVRHVGEDIMREEAVARAGDLIEPALMGVLAALGHTHVLVFKKPRVNILATGDELVKVDDRPLEGQIRNSNSVALAGYVHQSGGNPHLLGIVPDNENLIRRAIEKSPKAHILLISGGVSVGDYDLVEGVLQQLGVKFAFQSVNIRPGKPIVFGRWGTMLVFGLPGNPVSASVTFLQFVRPALHKMSGRRAAPVLRFPALMEEEITKHDGKRYFVRGVARQVGGKFHVRTTGSQNSGMMSSMVKANCLIVVPEVITSIRPGDEVEIEML